MNPIDLAGVAEDLHQQLETDTHHHPHQQALAGADIAQGTKHEGHGQEQHHQACQGRAEPQPECQLVAVRFQAVAGEVADVAPQFPHRHAFRFQHHHVQYTGRHELVPLRPSLLAGLHGISLKARDLNLAHVPDPGLVARAIDAGGAVQAMVGIERVDEHAPQVAGIVHVADMDEPVLVADPVTVPALEGGAIMERLLAQGLSLPIRLGGDEFPHQGGHGQHQDTHLQHRGDHPAHGKPRRPHGHQLTVGGQHAQPHETTQQGGHGEQLVHPARDAERDIGQGIQGAVVAATDVTHLADEGKEHVQGQHHQQGDEGATQHHAGDVTIQDAHQHHGRPHSRRSRGHCSNNTPSSTGRTCTHQMPMTGGNTPCSSQTRAVPIRL